MPNLSHRFRNRRTKLTSCIFVDCKRARSRDLLTQWSSAPARVFLPSALPFTGSFSRSSSYKVRRISSLREREREEARSRRRQEARVREKEKKRQSEKAFSHDDCCIVYDIQDKPAARSTLPCWIPFACAAVDQNYKAERASERPLRIPLSVPRIFFLYFFFFFFFVATTKKRK